MQRKYQIYQVVAQRVIYIFLQLEMKLRAHTT